MNKTQRRVLANLKKGAVTEFSYCSTAELRELEKYGYAKLAETHDNGIIAVLPGVNLKRALERYSI